jgi:hypothetical protein
MPLVFHQRLTLLWALGFVSVALSASPPATPLLIAILVITALTMAVARLESAPAAFATIPRAATAHSGTARHASACLDRRAANVRSSS